MIDYEKPLLYDQALHEQLERPPFYDQDAEELPARLRAIPDAIDMTFDPSREITLEALTPAQGLPPVSAIMHGLDVKYADEAPITTELPVVAAAAALVLPPVELISEASPAPAPPAQQRRREPLPEPLPPPSPSQRIAEESELPEGDPDYDIVPDLLDEEYFAGKYVVIDADGNILAASRRIMLAELKARRRGEPAKIIYNPPITSY